MKRKTIRFRNLGIALIFIVCVNVLAADAELDMFLEGASELPEADEVLQLHNRDVVAYFDLRELSTPLRVKNFQKTEEYREKLAELEEIRAGFYNGPVYARVQLCFGEYSLNTGKIRAAIPCPGDYLSRKMNALTKGYFDDPKVFNGVTFPALVTSILPEEIRYVGMEYYALDLLVSEEVAADLENNYPYIYLIGKITGSKQARIFEYDYWEGLSSGEYPVPTISKEVPVMNAFKLVIYDPETERVIYSKDYKHRK